MTLHPSQPWVPLFPRGTWAPTHCGSWVPLATERRHGLSISPVQNEQAAPLADEAVPARGPPVTAPDEGTVALGCLRTPLPAVAGLLLPIAPAQTAQGPRTVVPQKVVRAHSAPPDLGPRGHWRRDSSPSTSPTRRFRSSPAPSRRPFGAGMTKRLAGRPSPSPPRRSHSHRQSRHPSWDSSPPTSRFRGRHHISSSSSRSPSPKRPRTERGTHSHRDSRSLSQERGTHPYDSDIRLLRLRADSEEDRHIPSSHPRGSPEPAQSIGEDDSLSAAKVQKLFADLAAPPALSHYADPIPDSTATTQLVPYVRQSTTSSSSVKHSEPLETHGLFRNYQSFHRLSGDNEKEARTAAYYDLTSLMIYQTDEPPLINVSSARPKMEDPFPHGAVSSNEMKKKSEKMILQWPPQSSHSKVIDRTLGLYQHGPPPKAGTNEKWPPPTVKNPWDKSFVPKEFPTTHKIPSTMPKRWDLHSSSPLMLRPPLSTAVQEVPDAAISKSSSWLEAFAARAAHTATMSATSIISVYNFQQKVLEFLRDSAA